MLRLIVDIDGDKNVDSEIEGIFTSKVQPVDLLEALVGIQTWIIDEHYTGRREEIINLLMSMFEMNMHRGTIN